LQAGHIWGRFPVPPPLTAALIGSAKAMPANASISPGLAIDTTMPITLPLASSSGPPELPGFTDASKPVNLAKLMVGSEGTLGIVLEAKLKLVPLPKAKAVMVIGFALQPRSHAISERGR